MTVAEARKLLPNPCDLNRWYSIEYQGNKFEIMAKWSKRYRKSFIYVRYLIDEYLVYEDGTREYRGKGYRIYRETSKGTWKMVA